LPNRIIKESICTSPTIDRLSVEAERFFYRLIVKCDDYGLYYGDERILLGACFPLRVSEIKCDQVRSWLSELETVGLIIRYQVDDRVYISFTSWADHQNIRAKRRKYPEPTPENTMPPLAGDGNCDQLMAIAPVTRISLLGSRYSDLGSRSSSSSAGADGYSPEFLAFWKLYPRKTAKGLAWKAWKAIKAPRPSLEELEAAIERYKATDQWQTESGRFIPHPATWLNQRRWEDEPQTKIGGPRMSEKERKTMGVLEDYMRRHGNDEG
jgi:hypothetical protein